MCQQLWGSVGVEALSCKIDGIAMMTLDDQVVYILSEHNVCWGPELVLRRDFNTSVCTVYDADELYMHSM